MSQKVDYSKSMIYKLCCKNPIINDIYIGSTTNFKSRKNRHKFNCCNKDNKQYSLNVYEFIRNNGGWNDWDMIMIEEYSCDNKKQLETRERYWIEELKSNLNTTIPTRTREEYRINNKDKLNDTSKKYYEKNKDKINETKKEYYEKNKNKIKDYYKHNVVCDNCSSIVKINNLTRHMKTNKCLNFKK